MSRHHIAGSEVGRSFSPAHGSIQRIKPRRRGGLIHTAISFLAVVGLVVIVIVISQIWGRA